MIVIKGIESEIANTDKCDAHASPSLNPLDYIKQQKNGTDSQ